MKRILSILTIVLLIVPLPVHAQGETPYIIRSTKPISEELMAALNAWLAADAPSTAPYYIVTYAKQKGAQTFVSMVGVDLASPESFWDFEDGGDQIVWMGSVVVSADGTVSPFPQEQAKTKTFKLAIFSPAPGGGSYVAFPFQSGTGVIYGPRAVHGSGDYGTTGMLAVDLVSGDDLGSDAAPPYVYASDAGTIDYVCDDDTTVAIRTYNASTGDYFIYAHLLTNENLIVSTVFSRGELIGNLKYGTFDDTCGYAEQQEDHYHNHWMFTPANGSFQAEDCILSVSTKRWTCGNGSVGTGGWLIGGGGLGSGTSTGSSLDEATGTAGGFAEKSFWDYVIIGLISIFDRGLLKLLPDHENFDYVYIVINTIKVTLRIVRVLAYGNINLGPLMTIILYGIALNALMSIIWLASFVLKAWKSLVPILGA